MDKSIRILFVEDNKSDAELIWRQLEKDTIVFSKLLVETEREYIKAIKEFVPELIISDFSLPMFTGMQALKLRNEMIPEVPFILATGSINEEVAVDCIKTGADDYVLKERLSRLGEAVRSAFLKKKVLREKEDAERLLRESEEKYRKIVDFIPDVVIVHSGEKILFANPATLKMLGVESFERIKDVPLRNFVHPDSRTSAFDRIRKIFETGEPSGYATEKIVNLKNEVFETEIIGIPVTYMGKPAVQTIVRDITERKMAENKIIESETYYRTLVDVSPDGIIIFNFEGIITYASHKVYEIFKIPGSTDLHNTSILEWISPDYQELVMERVQEILSGKVEPKVREYKLLRSDHTEFWAELTSSPLFLKDGNGSLLVVCREITERKKAADDLIKARDKAEESDRLKTAFLHNISHEIRTPMNAIVGFSALLGEPQLEPGTRNSYVDIIMSSSNHLLAILNDIIDISNIEANVVRINLQAININQILKTLFKQFLAKANDKKIELVCYYGLPDNEAELMTDGTKFQQIITNLLSNAIKFTSSGSVKFGYAVKEKELEFFVTDTGIGIGEEHLGRIFDRFYQVENPVSKTYEGTGLGLAISKAYAELLHGSLEVSSVAGNGSTFRLTLQFNKPEKEQIKTGSLVKDKVFSFSRKKRILVAEDTDSNYKLIKLFLKDANVDVIRALNGKEAVEKCLTDPEIDLILMDMKMPVMDGFQATRSIRQSRPDIPIIAQTAYTDDKEKSIECGCSSFLAKPFDRKKLVEALREFDNN